MSENDYQIPVKTAAKEVLKYLYQFKIVSLVAIISVFLCAFIAVINTTWSGYVATLISGFFIFKLYHMIKEIKRIEQKYEITKKDL